MTSRTDKNLQNRINIYVPKERAIRKFHEVMEITMNHPMMRQINMDSEEYKSLRKSQEF